MWFMHEFGGWWMIGASLLMVLFWGGLIALCIWGISRLTRHNSYATSKEYPIDIARERYAKGEINKDQFDQIKKDLS